MTTTLEKSNLTAETKLYVHAAHKARWYRLDNVVFDRYAEAIGIDGFGLYAGLARYADNTTAQCYPSAGHLAKKLRTTVDHIATCLDRLEAVGLIHVRRGGTCPLITLLEPERTGPPVGPPPETVPLPDPPLVTSAPEVEKIEPVAGAYKEDQRKDLTPSQEEEREKTESLLTLGREEGEKDTESRAPAPDETPTSVPRLDPATTNPHGLPGAVIAAQADANLANLRACMAATDRVAAIRLGRATQCRRGKPHAVDPLAGACLTCGQVIEEGAILTAAPRA